jgi:hypothetical protein
MDDGHKGWISGLACCRVCSHTWVAVVPADGELSNLECPVCRSMSGELAE